MQTVIYRMDKQQGSDIYVCVYVYIYRERERERKRVQVTTFNIL